MIELDLALALAGRGLEGDRYHDGKGRVADEPLRWEPLAIRGYVLHLRLDPVFYGVGPYGLA